MENHRKMMVLVDFIGWLPSGKRLHDYAKSDQFWTGKTHFHGHVQCVKSPEGTGYFIWQTLKRQLKNYYLEVREISELSLYYFEEQTVNLPEGHP